MRIVVRRQGGAALLALLAVIMLGTAWMLTTRFNETSASFTTQVRQRNAEALNRAKLALIAYVAQHAADTGEANPGRLPCPELASHIGTAADGTAAQEPAAASPDCSSIGRFPWRSLGLEKLVDASGEPLWYVVGPNWRLTNNSSSLVINSNSVGDISVDGQAVVALIIAPGAAMNVQTATGCTARNQARSTAAPSMDARDYLECFDSGTLAFTTTAASTSFNDQVVRVTVDDVLPGLEAAIAKRIESQVVPVLNTVYTDTTWGTSASNPAFPFPAAFSDPTTSSYQGNASLTQGLLPFNYHASNCGGDVRCSSSSVTWGTPSWSSSGGPGTIYSASGYEPGCVSSGAQGYCYGYYYGGSLTVSIADPANNITTGLRSISTAGHTAYYYTYRYNTSTSSWELQPTQSVTPSYSLASSGAANFNATVTLPSYPSWGYYVIINNRVPHANFTDHSILSSTDPTTGWFVRNQWYRLLYYAIASGHAPGSPSYSCTTGSNCLQVTNLTDPSAQRAVLVLMGRALTTASPSQSRPSSALQDYLDGADNRDGDTSFVQYTAGRTSNDRFISLSKN